MSFLSLRIHSKDSTYISYPQEEIQVAARVAEEILKEGWPITHEAFIKHGRVAP
jgi:thymidylate synthase (FAD)